MTTFQGTIAGVSGHPMSGLWTLHFEDGKSCHIESGYGMRQLASCFNAHEGTGDIQEKIAGQELVYSVDEFGVLCGFTPLDDWEGPEIPIEGIDEEDDEEN